MKIKSLLALSVFSAALMLLPVNAYADHSDAPRIVDDAGILSEDEYNAISDTLTSVSEQYDLDIVLFYESASPEEYEENYGDDRAMYYCADLYDYGGYTDNGLALLITVDERKWALVTEGEGDNLFDSYVQSLISDDFLPYLKDNDFAGAGQEYADYISYYLNSDYSEDTDTTYTYDGDLSLEIKLMLINKPMLLLIALVIGLIVALIRILRLKGQLVSVRSQQDAANYVVGGSLKLRAKMDTYLYTTETRTKRETHDNDNSFTGSSGDSHTGSSGDF